MRRAPAPIARLFLYLALLSAAPALAAPSRPRAPPPGITVANWSPLAIREIYVSPSSAEDWGRERLEGRQVAAGDDIWLGYGGACRADLRVVFDNEGAEERRGIDLCRNDFIGVRPGWTTSGDLAGTIPPGLVLVRNRSGLTIARLYLFDAAAGRGTDVLGVDVLPDGLDINLLLPRAGRCDFSLEAAFLGEQEETRYSGIDLCRGHEITIAPRAAARN
ncbi:MAG: hypothetical protein J0H14_02310 [Alphaproteobacteria bacterium]|nr:hypothetical protein [Alphaproteobacteria bacterium]